MSEWLRKLLRIAGMVLIAASLCAIGYSLYNLISTEINTDNSLDDVEQMLQDFEAYTGDSPLPEVTAGTGGEQTPSPEPSGSLESPGATDETTAQPSPEATATAGSGGAARRPVYLGKLVFPSLGRSVAVREGATASDLASGAAHHPRSSPAGAVGNCVIYGHRNTVFRGFDKLSNGDTIRLVTPGATYSYHVASMAVVEPNDSRIFQAYSQKVMTLVTCYPFHYVGSAPQRYIVVCVLDEETTE